MQNKKSKGLYSALIISLIALAIVSVGGVYYYKQSSDAKRELSNAYMRSFHDMADYLNDIDTELKKTLLATDPSVMSSLSSKLYMQSEAAKACLSSLPSNDASFDNTSKFLSQVGDYSSYLSKKTITDGKITDEEYKNLEDLSNYAEAVNEEFSNMETAVYENSMSIMSLKAQIPYVAYAESSTFKDGMMLLEEMPQEYPSLIYDGPFSEHLDSREPEMLKNTKTVSRATAESVVSSFLGKDRAEKVKYESDGNGSIETYLFSDDEKKISIEITKQGGLVLWMLDSRDVKESRLSVEQAMSSGELFLSQHGYPSMKSSFYEVSDNIATINYAYFQDGVTMYPDLIKVKIALDNGEVLGFEAQGYIMCHKERTIPNVTITEEEAKQKTGTHLEINSVSMSYIPLESTREVYCYELSGKLGKNDFLIYINAETGREEKILMLKKSENGILTI